MYGNRNTIALTCEIYANDTAWQYKTGPYPDTIWIGNIKEAVNPPPESIEATLKKWLPAFIYISQRAINEIGDINRDGKINFADLVLLAQAYGSKQSDSNWNPKADIDENRKVGLSDLVLLAKNYGETYLA
jgi:hypothetical protein